jgi:hypothetical protein
MEGDWGRVDERAIRRQEKPERGTIYRAPTVDTDKGDSPLSVPTGHRPRATRQQDAV